MTGPSYGGGESLLWRCGGAKPEAGISEKVQRGHEQTELGQAEWGKRREKRRGNKVQQPGGQRSKREGVVNKMTGLYREESLGNGQPRL